MNRGYIGYSRSNRSAQAIDNHEMPLSMMNTTTINNFIKDCSDDFTAADVLLLESLPVSQWRLVARKVGPSSWHHTSSHLNKTNHYDLADTAHEIIKLGATQIAEYAQKIKALADEVKKDYDYAVVEVQVWGGTRKRPKLLGTEKHAGIAQGDWLHSISGERFKISANKTISIARYRVYGDLSKENPEFKGNVKAFNKLVKKLVK